MSEDLATVLEGLGVDIKRQSGDEINGRCPVHHLYKGRASERYSWYMNSETGLFHCFTCGARGNLPILVSQITNDPHAIRDVHKYLISSGLDRLENPPEEEEEVEADWTEYAGFEPLPPRLLEARELDADVATRMGVRYDRKEKLIITPVVSAMGKLMGWQGKRRSFFMNKPTGLKKSETLFGYSTAQGETGLLVESPLDVVRFHSVYTGTGISAVSSFGASVSKDQIWMLRDKFDRVILALDNDAAGVLESRRLRGTLPLKRGQPSRNLLTGFRRGIRWWDYTATPEAKDMGEMTDDQILAGLESITVEIP